MITVPAFFDETRRRATQEAGRLAGLEVLDIINEPTAAAVAFGYYRSTLGPYVGKSQPERIVVYDLGGGTFDVTILEIDGQKFRTLATDGDVQLGGRDFDERLINLLAEKFVAASRPTRGVIRTIPHNFGTMCKRQSTHSLNERPLYVPCFHAGTRMKLDVTRAEFERLTADLLDRTETTTQLVLRQAKLSWDEIDRVLLGRRRRRECRWSSRCSSD